MTPRCAPRGPLQEELLSHGDWSQGLTGWEILPPCPEDEVNRSGMLLEQGPGGQFCLKIDTRGREQEVDAVSDPFPIRGGNIYWLSTQVRLLEPTRKRFKVTIEWLDKDREHLLYANDWQGKAHGKDWVWHGGSFQAPKDAASARILLGITPEGVILFDDISFRAIGPALDIPVLCSDALVCTERAPLVHCSVRNVGGKELQKASITLTTPNHSKQWTLDRLHPGQSRSFQTTLPSLEPGLHELSATAASKETQTAQRSAPLVVSGSAPRLEYELSSGHTFLRFSRSSEGFRCIDILSSDKNDSYKQRLGIIPFSASVKTHSGRLAVPLYGRLSQKNHSVVISWENTDYEGQVSFEALDTKNKPGWFRARWVLRAREEIDLDYFIGPEIHSGHGNTGLSKDSAVFCGLEYLKEDELSSGVASVCPDLANRTLPHPNKVTCPLMAVHHKGWAVGLAWDPGQTWDGQNDRPLARFSSPNRIEQRKDHLMSLSLPGLWEGFQENCLESTPSYKMKPGAILALEAELFVLPVKRDVSEVVKSWYDTHKFPELPSIHRKYEKYWRHSVQSRLQFWEPLVPGWKPEYHREATFLPNIALHLFNYGIREKGDLARRARTQAEEAVQILLKRSSPDALGLDLALHVGWVRDNLDGLASGSQWLSSQEENGSWTFQPTEGNRSLGEKGETELGICAYPTCCLLRAAQRTGRKDLLEGGLRGVQAMWELFQRPAGGETWEVPLHAPNLRASALAVESCVLAYELTEEMKYLKQARTWATTGLPFVYTWSAQDRESMRFATISVFGATFYTHPWFGRAVQWVGIVYARALRKLAPYDSSFPWDTLAEGILLSCLQQQRMGEAEAFGNPFPGAIPDVYDLLEGGVHPAWIGPQLILPDLESRLGVETSHCFWLKDEQNPLPFLSAARPSSFRVSEHPQGTVIQGQLSYVKGGTCHSLLNCVPLPKEVLLCGHPLMQAQNLDTVPQGWWYDAERCILVVKHPFDDVRIDLEICYVAP